MSSSLNPQFGPELDEALSTFPRIPIFSYESVRVIRKEMESLFTPDMLLRDPAISHEDITIPGPGGDLILAFFRLRNSAKSPRPAIYYMHGGGMVLGNRFVPPGTFDWVKQLDAVLISVEYRLAPENVHPALIEDCYAGLTWIVEHAPELGINTKKIMVGGHSGGGGLAAGTALLARDRGVPKLCAQLLCYPMLDDRMETVSSKQFMEDGTWSGKQNITAWDWVLSGKRGAKDVSIYAAPSRATDLSGLPPTWIDVGSADLFRDENVAYASKLWECGVQAELHVWQGGWHAFDIFAGGTALNKVCLETRMDWLRRIMLTPSAAAKEEI